MSPAAVEARLRARGCSITAPRRAIVQFVAENRSHPTAHEVFSAVNAEHPEASRATVYGTLALLVEVGALVALRHAEAETRYDANTTPHHHAECPRCGRLVDVPVEAVELRMHGLPVPGLVRFTLVCASCG